MSNQQETYAVFTVSVPLDVPGRCIWLHAAWLVEASLHLAITCFASPMTAAAKDSVSGAITSPRLQSPVVTRHVVKSETSGWRQEVLGQL